MGESRYRYLPVAVSGADVELRAVYAPLRNDPYAEFWKTLLDDIEREAQAPTLLIGDLNSGLPLIDTTARTLFCSRYFRLLPERGYVDLRRSLHGMDARACTWQGKVNQYRLDHAFGTQQVIGRLEACDYDHSVREAGVSDHSMLSLELAGPR